MFGDTYTPPPEDTKGREDIECSKVTADALRKGVMVCGVEIKVTLRLLYYPLECSRQSVALALGQRLRQCCRRLGVYPRPCPGAHLSW